jgi:prepilin-type N-terminal cleavage/methylation domain-containing protein
VVVRPLENKLNSKLLLKNQGFTVIEILVALVLITLVMAVAISDPFNSSEDLYKEADGLERSIRFMGDEAALRNSVVRIHFLLDK